MAETRKEASENSCTASTKKKKMAETEKKIDRLSNLPDDLLYHILSFFPSTKLQVRTSILSKRWRHLWTHSPSLLFPEKINEYDLIVDRCLQLCNAPTLRRVKLRIELRNNPPAAAERAERCLNFAASRSTQELYLEFELMCMGYGIDYGQGRPLSLFRCQSLTILSLGNCDLLHFPGLSFPSLESLTLTAVDVDEATLNALLSSSPLLQTFKLHWGSLHPESPSQRSDEALLCINHLINPRLNKLSVITVGCILEVDSPHIRSFSYSGGYEKLRRPHPFMFLTDLKLECDYDYLNKLPPSIPSLRSLTLNRVKITVVALNKLLSGSLLLQTLELSHIELLPGGNLKAIERQLLIAHPRLENLTLCYINHRLKVDSPNLRTFCFSGHFSLLSLVHTQHLHLAKLLDFESILSSLSVIRRRNQIFSAISKAKILYIDSNQICQGQEGCLRKDHQPLLGNPGSKFHYLKELNYRVSSCNAFNFVPLLSVLTECPILENLCIQFYSDSLWKGGDEKIAEAKWQAVYNNHPSETLQRFELTMKYLKTIRLIWPIYSRYTMVFLDFLLQTAESLKTLVIDPVFNYARRDKIDDWILMVASKGLEVQIKDLDSYVAP